MPYRRYTRRKRSYKKKTYTKKRMTKTIRKLRNYARPDGTVSEKFVLSQDVALGQGATGSWTTALFFSMITNQTTQTAGQPQDTPEWSIRAAGYELMKFTGMSVKFFGATDVENAHKQIRSVESGTVVNQSCALAVANPLNSQALSQRLDYKIYHGQRKMISRFYKLDKIRKASMFTSGINAGGWMSPSAAGPIVDIGCHTLLINTYGYIAGDYIGRVEVTWYIKFKNRRVV